MATFEPVIAASEGDPCEAPASGVAALARHELAWLAGLYLASRCVLWWLVGVQFDLRAIDSSWHILDPELLRNDLLRSTFYTPGQPPLYNLLLGAVLKLSDDPRVIAGIFRGVFSVFSFASTALLYDLLRRLSVPMLPRAIYVVLFTLSPALILYESLPYYTVLVLFLLTLVAWLFVRCVERFSVGRAAALWFAAAALIYTRSLFQVHWFLALLGACCLLVPGRTRRWLLAAAVPLVLVLGLYAKNLVVTGEFATSSWLGLSVVKLSVHPLPIETRRELVRAGTLSPLALSDTTYDPPEQHAALFASTPKTGVAVLDEPFKSTRHANYHHLAYVTLSRQELEDAVAAALAHPEVYLRSVLTSQVMFWRPSSDYPYLGENRELIEPWSRLYARFIAGQPEYPRHPAFAMLPGQVGYLLAAGHLAVLGFGVWLLVRWRFRPGRIGPQDAALVFMWLQIVYVTVVGNALEIGENQRYRFYVHPLIICMLAVLLQRVLAAGRRAPASVPARG